VAVAAWSISVVMAPLADTMGAGSPPLLHSDDGNADVQEPGVKEPTGRSPPFFGEVSPDQVKNGGQNHIGKWFGHLTLVLFAASCLSFFSNELYYGLTQG
jgi:hypothetical protein